MYLILPNKHQPPPEPPVLTANNRQKIPLASFLLVTSGKKIRQLIFQSLFWQQSVDFSSNHHLWPCSQTTYMLSSPHQCICMPFYAHVHLCIGICITWLFIVVLFITIDQGCCIIWVVRQIQKTLTRWCVKVWLVDDSPYAGGPIIITNHIILYPLLVSIL